MSTAAPTIDYKQIITITPVANLTGLGQVTFNSNHVASTALGTPLGSTSGTLTLGAGAVVGDSVTPSGQSTAFTLNFVPSTSDRTLSATLTKATNEITTITFIIKGTTQTVTDALPALNYTATSVSQYGASQRWVPASKQQTFTLSSYNVSTTVQSVTLTFNLQSWKSDGTPYGALSASAVTLAEATPHLMSIQKYDVAGSGVLTVTYNPQVMKDQLGRFTISGGTGTSAVTTTILIGTPTALASTGTDPSGATGSWYSIAMDVPTTLYTNEVYTFKPAITSGSSASESVNPYYDGEYYILYGANSTSLSYYPYSNNYKKVYYNNVWVDPLPGTSPVVPASMAGATPVVTWTSIYKVQTGSSASLKLSFSTNANTDNASLTAQNDNTVLFLAKKAGTYTLTVSLPSGSYLSNGDGGNQMYVIDPATGNIIINPGSYSSSKTYTLTFVDKPDSSTNTGGNDDIVIIDDSTGTAGGNAPAGSKLGIPMKSGITVTDEKGNSIGTLSSSSIVVLETVGNNYKIQYGSGVGYVPKSLINLTSIDASQGGEVMGLNIKRWISLRSRASSSSTRIFKMYPDDTVIVIGESSRSGWTEVICRGETGFVPTKYLKAL